MQLGALLVALLRDIMTTDGVAMFLAETLKEKGLFKKRLARGLGFENLLENGGISGLAVSAGRSDGFASRGGIAKQSCYSLIDEAQLTFLWSMVSP